MLFELKIGKLIRRLNPYTNGKVGTIICGSDPTNLATLGQDLIDLGNALLGTAGAMSIPDAELKLSHDLDISDLPVRIDNDSHQDYMTWTFRGQPYAVARALRVTYRYQLTEPPRGTGTRTGVLATEHILIGYAGGNGGG